MNSPFGSPMNEVNMIAKLADIKEEHYHQLVTLSAIMELLVEKGILSRAEIEQKALEIDGSMIQPTIPPCLPLQACRRDPFDKVFLGEEEQQNARYDAEHGHGDDLVPRDGR